MIKSGLYEKMKEITIRVTTADDRNAVPTMNEILRRLLSLVCSKKHKIVRKQAIEHFAVISAACLNTAA